MEELADDLEDYDLSVSRGDTRILLEQLCKPVYRDALDAGKKETIQSGFNAGYFAGCEAGFVKGSIRGAARILQLLGAAAPTPSSLGLPAADGIVPPPIPADLARAAVMLSAASTALSVGAAHAAAASSLRSASAAVIVSADASSETASSAPAAAAAENIPLSSAQALDSFREETTGHLAAVIRQALAALPPPAPR